LLAGYVQETMGHLLRAGLSGALLLAALLPASAPAAEYKVKVARSAYGIPHITADNFASLAYGYAYTIAEDNICVLADTYVTVNAERSRFFGPDKGYSIRGNGSTANNLNSDFFYKQIIDEGRVEKLMSQPPPVGPRREILDAARGFVDGYNAYLQKVGGPDGVTDPACKGKPWVRPIDEITMHRRFYSLSLLASSGVAIDGIGAAQPATGARDEGQQAAEALAPGEIDERLSGLGSNALAVGKDGSKSGHGLVYGNPHFPWEGSERFYQSHLTIPGKLNVAGGSLMGVPLINIGHTDGMAWSHTVSTARRFTPFELKLVPGDPTSYVYDGQPREMIRRKVTVLDDKGEQRSRTLYSSHHGPILTGILGLPIFPWTDERAFALGDANDDNYGRLLNHFFEVNQAQTVDQVEGILKKYLGIPWVNTIAADTAGNAYYADIGSIPNVSMAKLEQCRTALGVTLDAAQRLPVLDGSTAACEWDTDPDAIVPGIFGPKNLPSMRRGDYTSNMNDSYWLTNPRQPLEGFSRIIGDERTARSLRTRNGLVMHEEIIAKDKFDIDNIRSMAMSNRVHAAELFKDEAVAMCKQMPFAPTSGGGVVSTAGACEALEAFNGRDDLESKGAVLFRRFASKALAGVQLGQPTPFREPFSASDPVNTPRGLNTASPVVRTALGDAINDLQKNGHALDSPLLGIQYEMRGTDRVPVHGGPGGTGVYNVITASWGDRTDDGKTNADYGDINHGSSFVQAVELTPGCPKARTILTYSQSTDPTRPYYADQNRVYEKKEWVTPPFCAKDTAKLRGNELVGRTTILRGVKVLPKRRAVQVRFQLTRGAAVVVTAKKGKKVVRRVSRKKLKAGRHAVTLRVPRGRVKISLSARAGKTREVVRVAGRRRG
jgi:acyl-homoserine-lactone acylase